MSAAFLCSICGKVMAGSMLINPINAGVAGMIVTMHMIDEHWDIVERIRATTGDGEARLALHRELYRELVTDR